MSGMMTRKEACEYLCIGDSTLHQRIKAGLIPFIQQVPGGKMYFLKTDLDAFLQKSRKSEGSPISFVGMTYRKQRRKAV